MSSLATSGIIKVILFGLLLLTALTVVYQISYTGHLHNDPPATQSNVVCKCPIPEPYLEAKREIARRLAEIYNDLANDVRHKQSPSPKNLIKLQGIIGELDPVNAISSKDKEQAEPKQTNSSVMLDVCPEKFMGEYYGMPHCAKGWVIQKCANVKPLNQVCD